MGLPGNELERIADQIRRPYEGDAWHGPALRELLSGVDSTGALRRPLDGAHSIWELVLHLAFWTSSALGALAGQPMPDLPHPGNRPEVGNTDEASWRDALRNLECVNGDLVSATSRLNEAHLALTAPGREYSFYVLLHGVAQHNIYHAGQIALLRKV